MNSVKSVLQLLVILVVLIASQVLVLHELSHTKQAISLTLNK